MKTPNNINLSAILCFSLLFMLIFHGSVDACTSVCLAKNGHVVFGNNLDWYIPDGMVVINKRNVKKTGPWFSNPPTWTSKYASITVNQEGVGFSSRGMNETGLVIGEMTLTQTEFPDADSRNAVNGLIWMQYQLDNCATIQDVIDTDKTIRIDKNEYHSHFFVCDSTGNCVVMEWLDGKLAAHAYDEVPVKVLANNTYEYSLAHVNDISTRFGKAAQMLDNYNSEDPVEYVFSILQAVSQSSTVWSLVFDSKNRRLYFKTASNKNIRYVSLTDFDLSCSSPVYLTDMNTQASGNLNSYFEPYSTDFNSSIVRSTYHQLEPQFGPFSEGFLQQVINYPLSFTCESTGVQANPAIHKIEIFPNPAETRIQITTANPSLMIENYRITDMGGHTIKQGIPVSDTIEIPGLVKGTYILSLSTNQGLITEKIMVK